MDRKLLEEASLTKEQIEVVMAENGKDIQREKLKVDEAAEKAVEKATKPLFKQLEEAKKTLGEYEEKLKGIEGIDDKTKAQIAELQKEHESKMQEQEKKFKEIQEKAEAEVAQIKREAETKEFFSSLGKKFITPETAKAFEERLNAALIDKAYEGKNRKDIFEVLIKGEDGKDRTDIFEAKKEDKKPDVLGAGGKGPKESAEILKPVPTII